MFSNGFDSFKAREQFYKALRDVIGVRRPRDYREFSELFKHPENKDNDNSKGDAPMNDAERFDIHEEVGAIARKTIENAKHKIYDMCADDVNSIDDAMACAKATTDALQRSTFDVHIIVQPREDGIHIKTTVNACLSNEHRDNDEE